MRAGRYTTCAVNDKGIVSVEQSIRQGGWKPAAAELHRRPLHGPNGYFLAGLLRDRIIDGRANVRLNRCQLRGVGVIKCKVPRNGLHAHVPKVALPHQPPVATTSTRAMLVDLVLGNAGQPDTAFTVVGAYLVHVAGLCEPC